MEDHMTPHITSNGPGSFRQGNDEDELLNQILETTQQVTLLIINALVFFSFSFSNFVLEESFHLLEVFQKRFLSWGVLIFLDNCTPILLSLFEAITISAYSCL